MYEIVWRIASRSLPIPYYRSLISTRPTKSATFPCLPIRWTALQEPVQNAPKKHHELHASSNSLAGFSGEGDAIRSGFKFIP
jgi:hypothetical protein